MQSRAGLFNQIFSVKPTEIVVCAIIGILFMWGIISMASIYGDYKDYLPIVSQMITAKIIQASKESKEKTGFKLYEHFSSRIKSEESMREKCQKKKLPLTPQSALKEIRDSVGIRVICGFVDDIYTIVNVIKSIPEVSVFNEKDYIRNAKPNGYRSYHIIIEVETNLPDCLGNENGTYFVEIQLRTIAQDSWASLEHQMKYKHEVKNKELVTRELKRVADELASCDLSMQTIRQMINEDGE